MLLLLFITGTHHAHTFIIVYIPRSHYVRHLHVRLLFLLSPIPGAGVCKQLASHRRNETDDSQMPQPHSSSMVPCFVISLVSDKNSNLHLEGHFLKRTNSIKKISSLLQRTNTPVRKKRRFRVSFVRTAPVLIYGAGVSPRRLHTRGGDLVFR